MLNFEQKSMKVLFISHIHELLSSYSFYSTQNVVIFITLVYIFLGTPMSLIDMMNSMQGQRLLDDGQYMVIHVDMMMYSQREAQKYLWSE